MTIKLGYVTGIIHGEKPVIHEPTKYHYNVLSITATCVYSCCNPQNTILSLIEEHILIEVSQQRIVPVTNLNLIVILAI